MDEIIRNNEIQNALPEDHPARSFGDAIHELRRDNDGEVSDLTTISKAISAEMETRFEQFQKYVELQRRDDRETLMKAIETISNSITTNTNRMDDFMVDKNTGVDLQGQYRYLLRTIDTVSVTGVTDHNFRAEFNGLCITVANVFFHTLGQKTSIASAEFIKDLLNVDVVFARPMVRWSSLCSRALLQGCAVLRIRQWICKERGLDYPNETVNKEILHSTYLNLRCYFSLISHIDRVWEEREYDGCVVLGDMVGALMAKFGADLSVYEIDQPIEYHYGARKAVGNVDTQPQSEGAATVIRVPSANPDEPFERFLRHFFTTHQRPGAISVEMLMHLYTTFATSHDLPRIETRRQLLLSVNRVSVRLKPTKNEGRIVGWKWT